MVDEQLRAAATALAAQQCESGKTLGVIHNRAPFLGDSKLSVTRGNWIVNPLLPPIWGALS